MTTNILRDDNNEQVLCSTDPILLDRVRMDNAGGQSRVLTFYLGAPSAQDAFDLRRGAEETFPGTEWSIREALAYTARAPYYIKLVS